MEKKIDDEMETTMPRKERRSESNFANVVMLRILRPLFGRVSDRQTSLRKDEPRNKDRTLITKPEMMLVSSFIRSSAALGYSPHPVTGHNRNHIKGFVYSFYRDCPSVADWGRHLRLNLHLLTSCCFKESWEQISIMIFDNTVSYNGLMLLPPFTCKLNHVLLLQLQDGATKALKASTRCFLRPSCLESCLESQGS